MNIDLRQIDNKSLPSNPRRDIFHTFRGIMISSFYDPTILKIKKASLPNELEILKSINRNTGLQFQSLSEIAQHVATLAQKKLLTD
mgnify:FL=1